MTFDRPFWELEKPDAAGHGKYLFQHFRASKKLNIAIRTVAPDGSWKVSGGVVLDARNIHSDPAVRRILLAFLDDIASYDAAHIRRGASQKPARRARGDSSPRPSPDRRSSKLGRSSSDDTVKG